MPTTKRLLDLSDVPHGAACLHFLSLKACASKKVISSLFHGQAQKELGWTLHAGSSPQKWPPAMESLRDGRFWTTGIESFGKHIGHAHPFLLLSNSLFLPHGHFFHCRAPVGHLSGKQAGEIEASGHHAPWLGLCHLPRKPYVFRLARPIQPCFAGEEDEHPEMHPDPGRDLSPFPPGDISSRVSSAAHIKEGKSLYNPGFRASACRITSLGKLMEEKRCSPGFLDCQLLHLLTDAKIPAFPHVVVLNNQVSASKSMLERI
nr:uncharacterized protein LOC110355089 isoform X1 [Columba livia]